MNAVNGSKIHRTWLQSHPLDGRGRQTGKLETLNQRSMTIFMKLDTMFFNYHYIQEGMEFNMATSVSIGVLQKGRCNIVCITFFVS